MAQKKVETKRPSLLAVMEKAGMDLTEVKEDRSYSMLRCPFHEDTGRPNFALYPSSERWRCYRCGIGGDVYDFVGFQVYENQWDNRNSEMFKEVLTRLKEENIPLVETAPPPRPKDPEVVAGILNAISFVSRVYHLTLTQSSLKSEMARQYLAGRGIDIETIRTLRLGFAAPSVLAASLAGYPAKLREHVVAAGIYHDDREFLSGRIIFPDVGTGGKVYGLVGRDTVKDSKLRYLSLPGLPKTFYRLRSTVKSKPILLTESMIDTVNLWQMQFQGAGTNGTMIAAYLINEITTYPYIAIVPQNDEAGREAVERWKIAISHAKILEIPYRTSDDKAIHEKDINDIYTKRGATECREILTEALVRAGVIEQP